MLHSNSLIKHTVTFSTLFCSLCIMTSYSFAIDESDLVKITGKMNEKCVEYYTYKGDAYCSTKAFDAQPVDPHILNDETQHIVFDHRPWKAAWGKKSGDQIMIEYVPMGDDINHWHELVTSQFFPGLENDITPKQFSEIFLQELKKSGFNPIVTYYENTPQQVIFEFRIDQPTNQIQDELQKITKGENGLYVLHYAIKQLDMGKERRDKWIQNFKASTIK